MAIPAGYSLTWETLRLGSHMPGKLLNSHKIAPLSSFDAAGRPFGFSRTRSAALDCR
jgi:hypothetical protein